LQAGDRFKEDKDYWKSLTKNKQTSGDFIKGKWRATFPVAKKRYTDEDKYK